MVDGTLVMNVSSSGLTGLTNLSSQTGTIGTVLGGALMIGLVVGAITSAHSWNTKGWLYRIVKWLMYSLGENVMYGVATTALVGTIYYVGSELGKFGENNPHLLYDIAWFAAVAIAAIVGLAILGYITKPIYRFAYDYATGNSSKAKSR